MECAHCGESIPDEDYLIHLKIKHPEEYQDYRQAKLARENIDYLYKKDKERANSATRDILDQYTERIERLIENLRPPLQARAAMPVIKASPFEAIQLTQIAISSGKSVEEVLNVYKEVCQRLNEGQGTN